MKSILNTRSSALGNGLRYGRYLAEDHLGGGLKRHSVNKAALKGVKVVDEIYEEITAAKTAFSAKTDPVKLGFTGKLGQSIGYAYGVIATLVKMLISLPLIFTPSMLYKLWSMEVSITTEQFLAELNKLPADLKDKVTYFFRQALCDNSTKGRQLNLSWRELTTAQLEQLIPLISRCGITELDLTLNHLTALSKSIKLLKKLTCLNLNGNRLTEVSESIKLLQNLTQLYLRGNGLTEVSGSIGLLEKLTWLDLAGNRLKKVPESMGKLEKLIRLDLSDNELTEVPESMGKLEKLKWLDLRNNPLLTMKGIPPSLIARADRKELTIYGLKEIRQRSSAGH